MANQTGNNKLRVLLMTVGLGQRQDPETTLYSPISKSIADGMWTKVVLLPSRDTRFHAEEIQRRHNQLTFEIHALPEAGMENNADDCFAFFYEVLARLCSELDLRDITVDYTRGTKAMSVGVALAAAAFGISDWRYIAGERGESGTVKGGTEIVLTTIPRSLQARTSLKLAHNLMAAEQFAAAENLASDIVAGGGVESALLNEAQCLLWAARFRGAWDRFDYREAATLLATQPQGEASSNMLPSAVEIDQVRALAEPMPDDYAERARFIGLLARDVIRNARRRWRKGDLEDALFRAYRALEMVGQARLFAAGLDSENLDPVDVRVQNWIEAMRKKGVEIRADRGKIQLPREKVARLLKSIGEIECSRALLDERQFGSLSVKVRNYSILTHGFDAKARTRERAALLQAIDRVEQLIEKYCQT